MKSGWCPSRDGIRSGRHYLESACKIYSQRNLINLSDICRVTQHRFGVSCMLRIIRDSRAAEVDETTFPQ